VTTRFNQGRTLMNQGPGTVGVNSADSRQVGSRRLTESVVFTRAPVFMRGFSQD
jgi:hypothetical protein